MTRKLSSSFPVVCVIALSSLAGIWAAEPKTDVEKPNIVFILADDLGIDGVGCYGSDAYRTLTPNIDALAKTGVRFQSCFSAPLCGPSRCMILTGRYAFRTGGLTNASWQRNGAGAKSKDEYPVARLLKENGYATCQAGKWRQLGETPKDWGFDEYCTDGTPAGWYWQKSYIKNGVRVTAEKDVYCPDIVHDFAIDFINRHKEKPFFLYYATHLVHLPMERTPDSKPGTTDEKALYADNLAYMDKQVGLLVGELDRLQLRNKTLIVFSGDNGTAAPFAGSIHGQEIDGHKGQMLEGGSRVPLITNWPGVTPAATVLDDLTDFSDFYPTFAEVAVAKMPKKLAFDGQSFAPQLHGERGVPRQWIFVQLGNRWYVRSRDWKLMRSGAFFDMKAAPFVEIPVGPNTGNAEARAGREDLEKVLARLNPAAGKVERP